MRAAPGGQQRTRGYVHGDCFLGWHVNHQKVRDTRGTSVVALTKLRADTRSKLDYYMGRLCICDSADIWEIRRTPKGEKLHGGSCSHVEGD